MKNLEVSKQTFVKNGRNWELCNTNTKSEEVYKDLAQAMISKKINCCLYIKSIKKIPLYNGLQRIDVLYDNGVKVVYTVADH